MKTYKEMLLEEEKLNEGKKPTIKQIESLVRKDEYDKIFKTFDKKDVNDVVLEHCKKCKYNTSNGGMGCGSHCPISYLRDEYLR